MNGSLGQESAYPRTWFFITIFYLSYGKIPNNFQQTSLFGWTGVLVNCYRSWSCFHRIAFFISIVESKKTLICWLLVTEPFLMLNKNASYSKQHNKMFHKIFQLSDHFEEWIWGPGPRVHESAWLKRQVHWSRLKPTNDPLQDNSPTKGFPKLTICLNSQHSGIIHKWFRTTNILVDQCFTE